MIPQDSLPHANPAGLRTIVFQSFRTSDVPAWIDESMKRVKSWASARDYNYLFVDDRMFEYAPDWYRAKCNNDVLLVSDLARLRIARELLKDYDRAVWIDADVLIFNPEQFDVVVTSDFAFSQELWLHKSKWHWLIYDSLRNRKLTPYFARRHIANYIAVFTRNTAFLDFYIEACQRIIAGRQTFTRYDVGTRFLTALHAQMPLPLVSNAGLFSPFILKAIAEQNGSALEYCMNLHSEPLFAANLCSSKTNETYESIFVSDHLFDRVVQTLLDTKGNVLNRWRLASEPEGFHANEHDCRI